MPSPFPGMNPYLENPRFWLGFHSQFVAAISQDLNAHLGESYIALVEEQIYIHEVDENTLTASGRADVVLTLNGPPGQDTGTAGVLDAPIRVIVPYAEAEALSRVEVRTREGDDLVTVVELLWPTNKRPGWNRDQYLTKRSLVLNSPAHFVEIDLLRGWQRMPLAEQMPSDYQVLVSRAEQRPRADLWAAGLRGPLPVAPIPLQAPDADAALNIQSLLHRVYDAGAYRKLVYQFAPIPPLTAQDAAWTETVLAEAGVR